MNVAHPDKIWLYKNFNMGTELDIAGEFIYDGIHTLNQMNTVNEEAQLFSFFYHIAVGIERLQKIIIVLFEDINWEEKEEFEKTLITHSHTGLNDRIKKLTNINLNARENEFLQLLNSFYNSARYDRFNLTSSSTKERELFSQYLKKQIPDKIEYHYFTKHILITPYAKEMIGRIIGALAKKYFDLVHKGCETSKTFTYELRANSKAAKIFLSSYEKNSLQKQISTEEIALKEVLVYLRNTKVKHGLLHYLDSIEPLDIDIAFLNDYINELAKGIVPQSLVDEIETLYEENQYFDARREEINVIGDSAVDFDFYAIHQCYLLMEALLHNKLDCKGFAIQFIEMYDLIDEDDGFDKLKGVPELCNLFINEELKPEIFYNKIKPYFSKLKKTFNY